jgi:putative oxidoreductase
MILTIQLFVFPQAWPEHVTWTAVLLVILTRGPGAVSLDHLVARWLARCHEQSDATSRRLA